MEAIGRRLQEARRLRGLSQFQLATAMGSYTRQMVSRIEHGKASPSAESLVAAAAALESSADFLLGLTDEPTPSAQLAARVSELEDETALVRTGSGAKVLPFTVSPTAADDEDGHSVDVMELASAAGGGAVIDFELVTDRIKFRRSWLARHGLAPSQCKVIGVKGDSMDPTLVDGCSILVDLNRRRRGVGHIFVIRTDDGLIVKRAGRDSAGTWQLVSDNPDKREWPTLRWPANAEIIGEVKWAARTFA